MSAEEQNSATVYEVVINEEEQYSIWPDYKSIPAGWKTVGKRGSKPECLSYIEASWTDLRPKSLRGTGASPSPS